MPATSPKRFVIVCICLWAVTTLLNLNGSSSTLWKTILNDGEMRSNILLSEPRAVRDDEWEVWTPAAVAQSRRTPAFNSENPSLGPGKVPLLYNLPVRHYTMLFRPQLWGFFLADFEHGYAWYWNFKIFGLLAAMFFLFYQLTGRTWLSAFGSLWILLSSYVQWWFSCPPMLPDMLASWALATASTIMLFKAAGIKARLLASCGIILGTMNFTLCMYPPYQIPLLYLGIIIAAGFILDWRSNTLPEAKTSLYPALILLTLTACLVTLLLWPFFLECRSTLEIIANTVYPGNRRTYGGALRLSDLFTGFYDFFINEKHHPESYDQPCAVANFYPLWLAALPLAVWNMANGVRTGRLKPFLLVYLAALIPFTLLPWPQWLCNATLFSFLTEQRVILAIGITGIIFTVMVINDTLRANLRMEKRFAVALGSGLSAIAIIGLFAIRASNPAFMTPLNMTVLVIINCSLIAGFFMIRRQIFALLLIGILAASNALINPVVHGLAPLLKAAPLAEINRLHNEDPDARWAVYGNNALSEFVMSAGVNVVSGLRIVPDLDLYRQFDPDGSQQARYNRYSFALFMMPSERNYVAIGGDGFPSHAVVIHPTHPILIKMNVKYFVFPACLPDPAAEGLILACALPENNIWIYRLPPPP